MLIFVLMFFSAIAVLTGVVGFIVASTQAIFSLCALLVFAFIALAIGTKNAHMWSWMFIAIIVMVGVETLAPHSVAVVKILAAAIAIVATIYIKRPIIRYVRMDSSRPANAGGPRLHPVMRVVLTLI